MQVLTYTFAQGVVTTQTRAEHVVLESAFVRRDAVMCTSRVPCSSMLLVINLVAREFSATGYYYILFEYRKCRLEAYPSRCGFELMSFQPRPDLWGD